ncbi:MAG: YkgJ family cysteine cluster protein [Bdellovibrionaceae bacterium]|nr:YkgJ family cysteine cluster protein [Bdellovibrionales bacterium]MCB9086329.1 YkgJ family cysteine cluster protein [Pseudobdellovibrionaceae bacterium]
MAHKPFYRDGLRFSCQNSGRCCISRGQWGYVYLTLQDRRDLARELKMTTQEFTRRYTGKEDGFYFLKENPDGPECLFLENNKCRVYKGRPTQCRTWPFWPEVMNPKAWRKDVVDFCPGANKGRLYTALEIKRQVLEQKESEQRMIIERTSS